MNEPDVLILDEPTNHLDLGKIFRLENWLREGVNVPYLMISHDREFLDRCTNKTLFMRSDGVHEFATPFSTARENLFQADALALRSRQREEAEIKRIERAAKRLKEWGIRAPQSDIAKKGQAMQSRADQLKAKQTSVHKEKRRDIKLHYDEISSNAVAIVQNTDITTPDGRKLFHIDRLTVKQGERICLLGLNGTGKSMFISRLIDELEDYEPGPSHENSFWFSPQVRLGYLDQHLERLPEEEAAFSFISGSFRLDRTQTTRELVNVGFPVSQQNMRIGDMSSGEKARLSLLVLKLSKPNFYVLDEPTNHLDIQGQEDLEDELDDKGHTCIFVSHDRKLVRGASTRFLEIRNECLLEVESPDPFFERLKSQSIDEASLKNDEGASLASAKKQKKRGPESGIK